MIYVAGPYTKPDPLENTRKAIDAWNTLVEAGAVPIVPHLTLLTHLVYPKSVEFWYEYDLHLLARCDYLLRLPGESAGADREVEFAKRAGIPIFKGTAEEFVE